MSNSNLNFNGCASLFMKLIFATISLRVLLRYLLGSVHKSLQHNPLRMNMYDSRFVFHHLNMVPAIGRK